MNLLRPFQKPTTDTRDFDRLWDEFGPRVRGYLFQLTGNRADADDLTQETFLAAYQGRATYRRDAAPLAWLLGIARRRWRDSQRGGRITTAPLDTATETAPDRAVPVAEQVTLRATLTDALNTLPQTERDVLLLTAVQGLTYRETAEILEEPIGTVKWRAFEATRKLRPLLAPDTSFASQPVSPRKDARQRKEFIRET